MEAFLLAIAIVTILALLLATQRFNHNIARYMPVGTKALHSQGQPLYLANTAGKWLTLAGGTATIPMVMGLIFIPESTSYGWTITIGAIGFVALLISAILLVSVCIGWCIARKICVGHAAISIAKDIFKKALIFFSYKAMLWIVGTFIFVLLFPVLMDLVLFIAFAVVFFVFAQFGLLDKIEIKEFDERTSLTGFYNYQTGKFDSGYEVGGMYDYHDDDNN